MAELKMSKQKKKRRAQSGYTRDAPLQTSDRTYSAWLCSDEAFKVLTAGQYTRLSDCPEVRMCVSLYADLISNMTLYLMLNTDGGDIRVKNELSRKLDIEPDRYMTRKSFIYSLVWNLMLDGDGNQIVLPIFKGGYLDRLKLLPPNEVSIVETPSESDDYKIIWRGREYSPDEVLHFRLNPDSSRPWLGTGYRTVLNEVTRGLKQATKTKTALMESPSPSIVIKVDGYNEKLQTKEGRAEMAQQYIDDTQSGKPWFMQADTFDIQTIKPLTLNDLAIAKNMEIDKRTAAGIFRVPPFLVGIGDFDREAYNNFISTGIMSVSKVIEQELTRGLLISRDMYWRFNQRSLMSYSLEEIVSAGSQMVDRISMRRNEWRDWIGLPPDSEMTELLALENYIPATMLGNQKKLTGTGGDET